MGCCRDKKATARFNAHIYLEWGMTTKPRVLFVLNRVLGWKTYCDQVTRALRDRTDVDIRFLYLTPSLAGRLFVKRHVRTGFLSVFRRVDPLQAFRGPLGKSIRREIQRVRPDFVHFGPHWPGPSVLPLEPRVPFSVALDATYPNINGLRALSLWGKDSLAREEELLGKAELVFPMSRWTERSLVLDYGVDQKRVHIIPPSVRPPTVGKVWTSDMVERPRVLFIGNDFLRKGGDRLVSWVQGPLADRCELHIVSHDKRARVSGPDVVFHGGMSNDLLLNELAPSMDLFCLPTRSDMSPYVLAEMAFMGLPSIASDIAGIPDLVRDGETGHLVSVQDDSGFVAALESLLGSASLRRTMGEASRAFAANTFNAFTNYNRLLDMIVSRL